MGFAGWKHALLYPYPCDHIDTGYGEVTRLDREEEADLIPAGSPAHGVSRTFDILQGDQANANEGWRHYSVTKVQHNYVERRPIQ